MEPAFRAKGVQDQIALALNIERLLQRAESSPRDPA
jgi:hypothetical protein